MELNRFLQVVYRNKWILIGVPLMAIVACYFWVRNMPNDYSSRTRIATGIVDRTDGVINSDNNVQEVKVNQDFSNLLELMQMKRMINQVSYRLMLHDLTAKQPWNEPSRLVRKLNNSEKKMMVDLLERKVIAGEELSLSVPVEKRLDSLMASMKYDELSIRKKLSVYRVNNSDFIDMRFEATNPQLAAYALNSLSNVVIEYYNTQANANRKQSIRVLDSLVRGKQNELRLRMAALQRYKVNNGVLDVNNQASTLISQIAEFESRRQEALKNAGAYEGALKNVNAKFDPQQREYFEGAVSRVNQDITQQRSMLSVLNDQYIKSGFDPKLKARVDSVQRLITTRINDLNDDAVSNPTASRQNLVEERLNLEVNRDMAANSVASLDGELSKLNARLYALVPNQANIQKLQDEIQVNSKELDDLNSRYNQASLESNFITRLYQLEIAQPGIREPSKKLLLLGLSAVLAVLLCLAFCFFNFLTDRSVRNTSQLAQTTGLPVIGNLPGLSLSRLDLARVWNLNEASMGIFRDALRSIRFEIDSALSLSKMIAITSLEAGEGKSFLAMNLAFAYTMTNKRVLLIDGNFNHPFITAHVDEHVSLEEYLTSDAPVFLNEAGQSLVVMGNSGGDVSIVELSGEAQVRSRLQALKNEFDIILIEVPALSSHNKAREWMGFAEKVIAVFEVGSSLNTKRKELLSYLQDTGNKFLGWVLNKTASGSKKTLHQTGKLRAAKKIAA